MKQATSHCKDCNKELSGRIDKKFCSDYCRSNYHTKINRTSNNDIKNIDNALKRNRRILDEICKSGTKKVPLKFLQDLGFKPDYFTHFDQKKEIRYCYDFALEIKENYLYIVKS